MDYCDYFYLLNAQLLAYYSCSAELKMDFFYHINFYGVILVCSHQCSV